MGILADKMLSAGVVSTDDVARVKRQETIERENRRKAKERREHREEQARQEKLKREAELIRAAALSALLSAGLTATEANAVLVGEKVDLAVLALLGHSANDILKHLNLR